MKRKLLGLCLAFLLAVGFAGQALAAFEDLDLIRVIQRQDGTIEIATDLGNNINYAAVRNLVVGGGAGAFTNFLGTNPLSSLYVSYFSNNFATADVWLSGTGPQISGARKFTSYNAAHTNLIGYYNELASVGGTVVGDGSNLRSYWRQMDKSGGPNIGTFAGFLNLPVQGSEVNLAPLQTTGYVDQYLYFFDNPDRSETGIQVAVIRTMADGTTIINPGQAPVVPIPPSVLLLGSGLLGLIAIRRRAS